MAQAIGTPVPQNERYIPHQDLYTPLEPWQIRLLKLLPDLPGWPLRGELLLAAPLQGGDGVILQGQFQQAQYQALSYSWGGSQHNHEICLNGRIVYITESLCQALQELRYSTRERLIWADAICINQNDKDEKNVQVQKMLDIYAGASLVVVWLGYEGRHTAAVLQHLPPSSVLFHEGRIRTEEVLAELKATLTTSQREDMYLGLVDLCTRPWVRRAWVQQEVFAAKEVQILCGSNRFEFDYFREFVTALERLTDNGRSLSLSADCLTSMQILKQTSNATSEHRAHLAHRRLMGIAGECYCSQSAKIGLKMSTKPECVLWQTRNVEATDLRDHVYSLLGLTDCNVKAPNAPVLDEDLDILEIDYNRSPSQVFRDLTKYIITRDSSIRVLLGHQPYNGKDSSVELPSWCPDWRSFSHCLHDHSRICELSLDDVDEDGVISFIGTIIAVRADRTHKRDIQHLYGGEDRTTFRTRSDLSRTRTAWHVPTEIPWDDEFVDGFVWEWYEASCLDQYEFLVGDIAVLPKQVESIPRGQLIMPVLQPRKNGGFMFVGLVGMGCRPREDPMKSTSPFEHCNTEEQWQSFTVY